MTLIKAVGWFTSKYGICFDFDNNRILIIVDTKKEENKSHIYGDYGRQKKTKWMYYKLK